MMGLLQLLILLMNDDDAEMIDDDILHVCTLGYGEVANERSGHVTSTSHHVRPRPLQSLRGRSHLLT